MIDLGKPKILKGLLAKLGLYSGLSLLERGPAFAQICK